MLAELNITSSPISRRSIDSDIASSPSIVFSAAQRKGTTTPFASPVAQTIAQAGPSQQRKDSGLGLEIEGMDPETLALIEQFQREEEQALEAEQRRRRQLEADEEFARKEQQSERDVWQRMQQVQSEQRLQQQQQIEQDEIRAVSFVLWDSFTSLIDPL
jgi:mitogen-activated protein kinase kinase kinase